ncbi:type II secretion system protein D [Bacteriovorax sp. BSW11_IV]|uniref:type II secretion system secretin GspD n=1 Tax=Bacteriovorax sp. BSW11_IV TaxID=1353529 RepID=UPI000389EE62|nr:type II secretion system secretin GspD [Bacteriovorax sp. BSW11_IV]EQC47790.1 type II secretion system protein D [Bacteriovorax sp. BSW11_IV]
MKRTFITLSTPLTLALALAAPYAHGQNFDKYKSATQYNAEASKPAGKLEESNDAFGRDQAELTGNLPAKDNKYVNLNPETAFGPEVITTFEFDDTSLEDLTKHMQKLTGINLIMDKDLKGKVSISAPQPITVGDAWKAYLTALNMKGYTLVKSGAFYKIVQTREIRYTPTNIYTGEYTPDTENFAMKIIPIKNISASEVSRSFRPFMSRYGRIIEIKQTNTIIIQDSGTNINRLVRLIRFIDVPGHDESLQIIPVKNSSAQEIAKLLDSILKGGGNAKNTRIRSSSTGTRSISDIKLTAETRTNSIIAMATEDEAKQLKVLIDKLDQKTISSNSGQIHVYYLNHKSSEAISKTLSSLVSNVQSNQKKTSRFTLPNAGNDGSSLFSNDVKITSDKDNNALVVTASPTDYLIIKEVIKKLDIPSEQVFVEGMIMETNIAKNKGYGVNIFGAYGKGGADRAGFLGGSQDLINLIGNQFTSLGGLFIGGGLGSTVTTQVNGQDVKIDTINGLIRAVATNGNANILATPALMVLDNTEGVFEVGETIPTPERTNAANGSTSVSIKQQKVALTLKITPQINKATRVITMKIDQQIDDFSNRPLPDGLKSEGVATTTRKAVTSVVVRDRDTIAMSGLMRDKETETESKVPLLGDVPVLGWLFRNYDKRVEKVNMTFFLTPRIVSSYYGAADNVQDVLNRRHHHMKEAYGEDDPFGTTVKGLYEKAKKQKEGPLYDKTEGEQFRNQNQDNDGIRSDEMNDLGENGYQVPDYKAIEQEISRKQAAVKK